jgi:hypothetical protein
MRGWGSFCPSASQARHLPHFVREESEGISPSALRGRWAEGRGPEGGSRIVPLTSNPVLQTHNPRGSLWFPPPTSQARPPPRPKSRGRNQNRGDGARGGAEDTDQQTSIHRPAHFRRTGQRRLPVRAPSPYYCLAPSHPAEIQSAEYQRHEVCVVDLRYRTYELLVDLAQRMLPPVLNQFESRENPSARLTCGSHSRARRVSRWSNQ